jgi:sodium-dependent dicarboxylate transporter 2/3/5
LAATSPTADHATPRAVRNAGRVLGVALFLGIELFGGALAPPARHAAAVAATMIAFWMTEALPISVTALLPLVLFPWLDVFQKPPASPTWILRAVLPEEPGRLREIVRTLDAYLDANTFLFMGGMCIAGAMERWNLHRRIALTILAVVGGGATRLVLGFVLATAAVSMWISNTATAVMMMPIGLAVIRQLEAEEKRRLPELGLAIMLAVAYAANVGGIGTKIGTGPNLIFCDAAEKAGQPVSFLDFLAIGLPFMCLFLPLVWLVLARIARREGLGAGRGREAIVAELRALGAMSGKEQIVALVFLVAAAVWIAGQPLSKLLSLRSAQMDALTAMSAAAVLVVLGALDFAAVRRVPWHVLVLLSGSFAMAEGIGSSGLVELMSRELAALHAWPDWLKFLAAATAAVGISAAASNVATTTLLMSVLRPFGVPLMATAAVAASCDFMLPAGTPPNAIVFGSGYVSVPRMMRTGVVLDASAALLAAAWGLVGLRALLG